MTHLHLLQQCFPIEVARKIMRFHSHPTADILRSLFDKYDPYEFVCNIQEFIHYRMWHQRVHGSDDRLYGCGCRTCTDITFIKNIQIERRATHLKYIKSIPRL